MFNDSVLLRPVINFINILAVYFKNSALFSLLHVVFKFINKLTEIYYASLLSACIKDFCKRLKICAEGSAFGNIIRRKGVASKAWESSIIFKFLDWLCNSVAKKIGFLFERARPFIDESYTMKVFVFLTNKFESMLGAFFLIMFLIPDKKWYNIYTTLIMGLFFILFYKKVVVNKYVYFNVRALDPAFIIFVISVVLSYTTSLFPGLSFRFLVFYLTCFLMVVIIVSILRTGDSIGSLLDVMLVGVSISGMYGIWQNITHSIPFDPSLTDVELNQGMPGRIMSTMGNPNNYAEVLIMTIPFFLAVIFNSKTIEKKVLYGGLLLPVLGALVLTGSRSAWASFALSMGVLIFLKNRRLLPATILICVLAVPFLPDYIYKRILTIFNLKDSSTKYRSLIFNTYWPMFKDYWITGLGLGTDTFMKILGNGKYYSFTPKTPVHTHMLYSQLWIEVGFAGIASFLWMLARMIKNCCTNIFNKTDEYINNILIAGVSAMVGIFLMGMVEYIWYYPRVMLVFWIDVGIILAGLGILAERKIKVDDGV